MYQEIKKLFDMKENDFENFCDCNTDYDGYCKKTCKLYGTEICKLIKRKIDLRKLFELNDLKELELAYIDRHKV